MKSCRSRLRSRCTGIKNFETENNFVNVNAEFAEVDDDDDDDDDVDDEKNTNKENNFGNAYRGRKEGLAMEGRRSTRTFRFCFMKFRWNFHVLIFMKFRPVIYPLDPFLQP